MAIFAVCHDPLVRKHNSGKPLILVSHCRHVNTNTADCRSLVPSPTSHPWLLHFRFLLHFGTNVFQPFHLLSSCWTLFLSAPHRFCVFFSYHLCLTARMNSGCSFWVSVCCTWAMAGMGADGRGLGGDTDLSLRQVSRYLMPGNREKATAESTQWAPPPTLPSSEGSQRGSWSVLLEWGRERVRFGGEEAAGGKVNEELGEPDSHPDSPCWTQLVGGAGRQRRLWGSGASGFHGATGTGQWGERKETCVCAWCASASERATTSCCLVRWCWQWSGSPRSWSDPSVNSGALPGDRPQQPNGHHSQRQQSCCWMEGNCSRCRRCRRCSGTLEYQSPEALPQNPPLASGWLCWLAKASAAGRWWSSAPLLQRARTASCLWRSRGDWAGRTWRGGRAEGHVAAGLLLHSNAPQKSWRRVWWRQSDYSPSSWCGRTAAATGGCHGRRCAPSAPKTLIYRLSWRTGRKWKGREKRRRGLFEVLGQILHKISTLIAVFLSLTRKK